MVEQPAAAPASNARTVKRNSGRTIFVVIFPTDSLQSSVDPSRGRRDPPR
jgi:hypothetical protein